MSRRALAGAVLGGGLGAWLAGTAGGAFVTPDALDPARWNVIVSGRDESVVSQLGRGTQVVGGALVLTPHTFRRSDQLVPRDGRALGGVALTLAPDSGPVMLRLRGEGTLLAIEIAPDAWRVLPGGWTPYAAPFEVRVEGGEARVGGASIGRTAPPTLELSAKEETARILALRLRDEAGADTLVEDPVAAWRGRAPLALGAVLGMIAGAAALWTGGGGLVALAVPIGVALVPHAAWLGLVERLYLVRLAPYELARAALALAFAPLFVGALARSGRAMPGERPRRDALGTAAWVGVAGLAAAFASRDGAWAWAPLGLGVLLAPLLLARAARLDPVGLLVRDLPAAAAVAALGWGPGLLPAVAWRLVLLVAGAGSLLRRAPRAAADGVFVLALALPFAAELAARSTWLDTAWDTARLEGDDQWRDLTPFWEGACGSGPRRTVLYAGGSSTGGAYQFHDEPDAFFPSRVHARLCAGGASLRTTNHGDGGRDTFTLSRTIEGLLAAERPDLVVVYVGVNDLLSATSLLTRAEREAQEAAQGAAMRGFAALGARSRLVAGLSLLARPAIDQEVDGVSDVPLPDAEANLRRIAAAARAAGATVLLVPEHVAPETTAVMAPYAAMEARLAAELPGVELVEASAALAPYAAEGLLFDRNHLSRAGTERMAELLAPRVAALAGLASPPVADGPG